jgi:hypothetical protein
MGREGMCWTEEATIMSNGRILQWQWESPCWRTVRNFSISWKTLNYTTEALHSADRNRIWYFYLISEIHICHLTWRWNLRFFLLCKLEIKIHFNKIYITKLPRYFMLCMSRCLTQWRFVRNVTKRCHVQVTKETNKKNHNKCIDLRFSRRWLWRMPSSGMWRRVDLVWTDVSEERISIFMGEKSASEEPAWAGGCRQSHRSHRFLVRGFFYPEDGRDTFLRNVSSHNIYTVPHPRRRHSSNMYLFATQNLSFVESYERR